MGVDAHSHLRVRPVAAGIGDVEQHLADAGHRISHTTVHIHGGVGVDLDAPLLA